jgi:hypothetical protein
MIRNVNARSFSRLNLALEIFGNAASVLEKAFPSKHTAIHRVSARILHTEDDPMLADDQAPRPGGDQPRTAFAHAACPTIRDRS